MRATMASAESDSDSGAAQNRIRRQSTRFIFDLDPGYRWRQWLLDVADALVFVEVSSRKFPLSLS
jgi:hypothetical protein